MDGISTAASAIAVISLAIQLAGNAKMLYEFWHFIDEAPASICAVATDLKLLSTVLNSVAAHNQLHGPDPTTTSLLESCANQVNAMVAITKKLENSFASTSRRVRKWTAVKAAFNENKIAKFQALLDQAKTTLILARQTVLERRADRHFDIHNQMMVTLTQNLSCLQLLHSQSSKALIVPLEASARPIPAIQLEFQRMASEVADTFLPSSTERGEDIAMNRLLSCQPGNHSFCFPAKTKVGDELPRVLPTEFTSTAMRKKAALRKRTEIRSSSTKSTNAFGSINISSTGHRIKSSVEQYDFSDNDVHEEERISFIVKSAPWLAKLGLWFELRLALTRSPRGWKHVIQAFRPVPDDSLIFEFCQSGNVSGVQMLLSRREASVWDVNSRGDTPLHIAARWMNLNLCTTLIAAGADIDVRNGDNNTCLWLTSVAFHETWQRVKDRPNEVIDLLRMFFVLADIECEDDDCWSILLNLGAFCKKFELPWSIFIWMIRALSPTLLTIAPEGTIYSMLSRTIDADVPLVLELALDACGNLTDALSGPGQYSALFHGIYYEKYESCRILARRGANLHLFGRDHYKSPTMETPTSVALYSSASFFKWREVLKQSGVALEDFVRDELLQSPLRDEGWEEKSLLTLFHLQFEPKVLSHGKCCDRVSLRSNVLGKVELPWQELIDSIKYRKDNCVLGKLHNIPEDLGLNFSKRVEVESSEQHIQENWEQTDGRSQHITVDDKSPYHSKRPEMTGSSQVEWVCVHCWHRMRDTTRDREFHFISFEGSSSSDEEILSSENEDGSDEDSPFLLRV